MGKDLICPNIEICPVYKLEHLTKYDCIKDKGSNYSCEAVERFNYIEDPKKDSDMPSLVSKAPAECALIEILNRVRTL